MKNARLLISALLLLSACGDTEKATPVAENNVDAVRNFIRSALDGKFNEARGFMLQDTLNNNLMDAAERSFNKLPQADRDAYRASSIRFPSPMLTVNDSTCIVFYANSYKNVPETLKVVRQAGKWLVDFKYYYQHKEDTLFKKPLIKDSTR